MRKSCLLAVAVILLGGCGSQFLYNQLDWLGVWYLNRYVSLDDRQEREFRHRWEAQLYWHRQTQLPSYAVLLEEVRERVNAGLMEDDLKPVVSRLEEFYHSVLTSLAPDLVYMASTMREDQVEELLDSLDRENRKWETKYIAPGADIRNARRIRDTIDRIEDWTGPLRPAQQRRVREWNQELQPVAREMLAQRRKWRTLLEKFFENRWQPVTLSPLQSLSLTQAIRNPEVLWEESYREKIEHNQAATLRLVLDLAGNLSERQLGHLNRKLETMIRDFREWSDTGAALQTADGIDTEVPFTAP